MDKQEMICMMGDRIGEMDGDGRYPDLEQDAMRYWLTRELLCNMDETMFAKFDQLIDDKIKRILG